MAQKKKIVIAECDSEMKETCLAKLRLRGYEVTCTDNGNKVMKLVKKEKPDLVITDILLPGKDGFEIIKRLKKDKDTTIKNIPIFVVSDLSNEEDIYEAKKLGADKYIIKSDSNPDEIIGKIDKFFNFDN